MSVTKCQSRGKSGKKKSDTIERLFSKQSAIRFLRLYTSLFESCLSSYISDVYPQLRVDRACYIWQVNKVV